MSYDLGEPAALAPGEATPWLVVLLASGGAVLLPSQRLELRQWPTDYEPVDVVLMTRFEDAGLTDLVPRELVTEVRLSAEDPDAAIAQAGAVGGAVAALLSFAVNAFVPPPAPYLAYEAAPGLTRRQFWQREFVFQQGPPLPSRRLDEKLLFPFSIAFFQASGEERIGRALGQYHVALSHWTTAGRPLALAHLYMALEALGPVAERRQREQLALADQREHALRLGVDVTRSNWKEVLLGWIRRDVLCQGDKETYDAARKASDGFEHGSMQLPMYRAVAEEHGRALLDYVRAGLLNLLDVPENVRSELVAKRPLDVSPFWNEIRGELHGEVRDPQRMGEAGQPYPYADWQTTLQDVQRLPDGQLQVSPTITLTAHVSEGVQITYSSHRIGIGLSDVDLFDYQPPSDEP